MLQVTDEQKNAFLKDTTHKDVRIQFDGYTYDTINYFVGSMAQSINASMSVPSARGESFTYNHQTEVTFYPEGSSSGTFDLGQCVNFDKFNMFRFLRYTLHASNFTVNVRRGIANVSVDKISYGLISETSTGSTIYPGGLSTQSPFTDEIFGSWWTMSSYDTSTKFIKGIRIILYLKFENVTYEDGYLDLDFGIKLKDLMITAGDNIKYPAYEPSPIVNGVYPPMDDVPEDITNRDLLYESFEITQSLCSQDNIKYGLCEAAKCSFTVANRNGDEMIGRTIKPYIMADNTGEIPLGKFKITSVSKTVVNNLVKTSVVAYDDMANWDTDSSYWYSKYMYGIRIDKDPLAPEDDRFNSIGVDFTRQMYSTYYNIAKKYRHESDSAYDFTLIGQYDRNNTTLLEGYTAVFGGAVEIEDAVYYDYFEPRECVIQNPDPTKLYKVEKSNEAMYIGDVYVSNPTDNQILNKLGVKSNKNGILTNAAVMVVETLSDGSYNKFLVDIGDLFALSDDCAALSILYGFTVNYYNTDVVYYMQTRDIVATLNVYSTPAPSWVLELVNRSTRLVYYDWESTDFTKIEDSGVYCTKRDVYRSLFEINGAFTYMDRYGKLTLLYPSKNDIYPSTTLYPSETIYPSRPVQRIALSRYSYCRFKDYKANDYGQIQIKSGNQEDDAETLKLYIGSNTKKNTYIIDDNIFYSNSYVKYNNYDKSGSSAYPINVLPEVDKMLERMYIRIKGQGFTPYEADMVGMPWLDVGDRVTLLNNISGFSSFIFRRRLKGIQRLVDECEASGDETINAYT